MESKPDFLCITESWLNSSHEDFEFNIEGYVLYRRDRELRSGGGVAVYATKTRNFAINKIERHKDLELICLEVTQTRTKSFRLITIYEPPDSGIEYNNNLLNFFK